MLVVFFYVFDWFFCEGGEDICEVYKCKILCIFYILLIKVLGIDVQCNLQILLKGIVDEWWWCGEMEVNFCVGICIGDMFVQECSKFICNLLDILIIIFELFYLMLIFCVCEMLCGVEMVIIDEVYVVVGSKCGVYLVLSLEWFDVLFYILVQ